MSENKLDLIFKAYDIRGIFRETLTPEIAYKIGYAYAEFVESEKIIIGHDGRLSNKEMLNAVASGIKKNNKSILYIGTVPTDVVYSLSGLNQLPGLIIRTEGAGRGVSELQWEVDHLTKLWKSIKTETKSQDSPFLIYQESDITIRALNIVSSVAITLAEALKQNQCL